MNISITSEALFEKVREQAGRIAELEMALEAMSAQNDNEKASVDKLQRAFNAASERVASLERDLATVSELEPRPEDLPGEGPASEEWP